MSSYITESLRELVAARADYLCEYCLIHEKHTVFGCQVDHIISLKHDGPTEPENLAYACAFCNRNKGSDIGSILSHSREFIRFFNPRTDWWADHFKLVGYIIEPITQIAMATTKILGFNHPDRILERKLLISVGKYPSIWAKKRMREK